MQNTTLPIQISSAGNAPAPARSNGQLSSNGNGFSQSFAQAAQRHAAPPVAPAPKPPAQAQAKAATPMADKAPAQPARPADGAKPAQAAGASAPTNAPASAPGTVKNTKKASDDARADQAAQQAADAQAAANSPVLDMLALVAGLQPVIAQVAQAAGAAPADALLEQASNVAGVAAYGLPGEDAEAPILADALAGAEIEAEATPVTPGSALGTSLSTLPAQALTTQADAGAASARVATDALADADATSALPTVPADRADSAAGSAKLPASFADVAKAALAAHTDKAPARTSAQDGFIVEQVAHSPAGAAPAQQTTMAQAVANAAGDKLSARVGTTAWDNQVSQKIVWMVAGGEQSASLTLNPPDLGPMQVVLSVNNEHADVTFSAAQPEVRQALEDALPRLREMMSESGLSLGNASVNAGMPEGRQSAADMAAANGQGGRGGNDGNGGSGETGPGAGALNGSAAAAEAQAAARSQRSGAARSMVDTFV